ncbi:hypothetical protein IL306_010189 [Fusarium sp. DS 682]|nr:hypothetical protein IL306_010189 [Fusarium sp. DS 682]
MDFVHSSDKADWEVRVTEATRICHETNPLGRLVVTLQNTTIGIAAGQIEDRNGCDVHFHFDVREPLIFEFAKKDCVKCSFEAQWRMRSYYIPGKLILWEFSLPAKLDPKTKMRFMIIATPVDNTAEQTYRAILSRDGCTDVICFDFENKTLQVSQRGFVKSLPESDIYISTYDANGKSGVNKTKWEELTGRVTKPQSLRATFMKSQHERTADDWLNEVDDLISAMRGGKSDPYDRVKVAIIDSGLHDRERWRYRVEYKDFTGQTSNDSWHGTCCAGIIQGLYEEARLYIARVFERDHADEVEGPLRMARAIHWAIDPPRSVDIISISAGFRHYSKELDDAVTRAKAAGVLIIAAASNWQNTNSVAFPARHNLSTMCIYSTNTGNQSSSFNPEPRADTPNFAILGEGFQHPDQANERMSGTSSEHPVGRVATAVAAGLAARIVDFSRQRDNMASIFRVQDICFTAGVVTIEAWSESRGG